MGAFLNRMWNLRPGELGLVLVLGFALFSNALAQKVSEIVSISSFLSDVGAPQFLLVLIISSAVSIVMTGVQSVLVDRFDRIQLIRMISFGLGFAFVVLRLLFLIGAPSWLNYSLFYLLSEQQFTFFPLAFWILSNDVFEVSQSTRIFPLLGSLGFWGSLIGIGVAALSPQVFAQVGLQSEEVLMLNILIYLLIFLVLDIGLSHVKLRRSRQPVETLQETLMEGWEFVQQVPAFRYLTFSILAVVVCENIIDFHFYVVSESAFLTAGDYQTFLSLFSLGRVVAYLGIQSFLAQPLLTRLGLKNTFLVQPLFSLGASVCAIALPGLGGSVASVALQKLPQYTVDETARKAFQGFVPEERRGRVSLFMDSYLVAGGAIAGAVITGSLLILANALHLNHVYYVYLSVAVVASLGAIASIFWMRNVYDSSLLNWRLKRRQRGKSILDKLEF
jgi:ATP:ADP antiporter, AAA family